MMYDSHDKGSLKQLIQSNRLLVLGHRNLIKNMKQTAVINIVKNCILLT